MTIKTDRKSKKRGQLLASLQSLEIGESFYTDLLPKSVTSYSAIYQVRVSTEIVLILEGLRAKEQKVKRVTKVTLI